MNVMRAADAVLLFREVRSASFDRGQVLKSCGDLLRRGSRDFYKYLLVLVKVQETAEVGHFLEREGAWTVVQGMALTPAQQNSLLIL